MALRLLINSCLLVATCLASSASTSSAPEGRFRLALTPESRTAIKLLNMLEPEATLDLGKGTAKLISFTNGTKSERSGTATVDGSRLILKFGEREEDSLVGEVRDDQIVIGGFCYKKVPLEVTGTWLVTRNGQFDKTIKFTFRPDGTWRFAGMGFSSAGQYTLKDGSIELVWTEVDGEAVEPGAMRKRLPMTPDGHTFHVDTYTYQRA